MQEAKYLWHWKMAYIKEREKNQAEEYLQTTVLYQIVQNWKAYTHKRIQSRYYFGNVVQRNSMSNVFYAWTERVRYQKKLKAIFEETKENTRRNIEGRCMYQWLSKTQEKSIQQKMTGFYQHKTLREIFNGWREYKDKNNAKRLRVYKIRQAMEQRPEYKRPLLALKQFTLFKAFNKLVEGSALVYDEDKKS